LLLLFFQKKIISELTDKQKADAMKAFQLVDKDNSGTISDSEFFNLLKILYPNIQPPEMNRIYHQVDSNRSGEITYEEFLEGIIQYQWNLEKLSASMAPKRYFIIFVFNLNINFSKAVVPVSQVEYEWEIPYSVSFNFGNFCV
jgi:hypothetical protein